MSTETVEPKRLINTHDQLVAAFSSGLIPKNHAVAISSRAPPARGVGGGTHVWSPIFNTDPSKDNAWYNHRRKAFYGYGTIGRNEAVEQAKVWVRETYGFAGPWKRNAFLDWVPETVQKTFPLKRRK